MHCRVQYRSRQCCHSLLHHSFVILKGRILHLAINFKKAVQVLRRFFSFSACYTEAFIIICQYLGVLLEIREQFWMISVIFFFIIYLKHIQRRGISLHRRVQSPAVCTWHLLVLFFLVVRFIFVDKNVEYVLPYGHKIVTKFVVITLQVFLL